MDQLGAMRVFMRVVESGSFSATAREEGTSQSTISKKVSALEGRLGVKLLSRTSRELSLTEAGSQYYERCQSILAEIAELESDVKAQVSAPVGVLRIAAPAALARILLAPLLVEFLEKYPEIEVNMSIDERHVDLIEQGIDVAIRAKKLEDSTLIARPLLQNPLLLVASPDYLAKHGEPQHPFDLKDHECIVYTYNNALNKWSFMERGSKISVVASGRFRSNNGETNLQMALGGMGITQLPVWMVGGYLASGELVQILTDFPSDEVPVNVIYPQNRYVPLKVRCFVDFIRERLAGKYS